MPANINQTIINTTITPAAQVTAVIKNDLTIQSSIQNGARGKSAYEVWVSEGHNGTPTDFLNWLKSDSFIYTQIASSSEWTITHNLGKYPSVTIVDSVDRVVVGEIEYISVNQLKVSFMAAFSGKAYLN